MAGASDDASTSRRFRCFSWCPGFMNLMPLFRVSGWLIHVDTFVRPPLHSEPWDRHKALRAAEQQRQELESLRAVS